MPERKRPINKFLIRYDAYKGKHLGGMAAQAPMRKEAAEPWIDTIENARKHNIGAVLDHHQVRLLIDDWNALVDHWQRTKEK